MPCLPPPPPSLLDHAALFLDFDGTLVELADTPDSVVVPGHLPSLLQQVARRLGGRLAIVTGRTLADLERHFDLADLACSGSHGLELKLADGAVEPLGVHDGIAGLHAEAEDFAARFPGAVLEKKPAGLAIHYRQTPGSGPQIERFVADLARRSGLAVQGGKMVAELRPDGTTKADAVRRLMAQPGFAAARPVFVGDDLTDEHGFAAAAELGGAGVLVGPPRDSAAHYRLASVAAVADWLGSLR